jgi:hypothetical protein
MIKKIAIVFILFFSFTSIVSLAQTSQYILFEKDNFQVISNAIIKDSNERVSIVKNSSLNILYFDPIFNTEEVEPRLKKLIVTNDNTGEIVFDIKSPGARNFSEEDGPLTPEQEAEFDAYWQENELFFENTDLDNQKYKMTIPLTLEAGTYIVNINLLIEDEVKEFEYTFRVADSYFTFLDSNFLIEDGSVLFAANYTSFSEEDIENKVKVTIFDSNNQSVFENEMIKTFYSEGVLTVSEDISELDIKNEKYTIVIEVFDEFGNIILTYTDAIKSSKSQNLLFEIISVILISIVLVVFVLLRLYVKKIPTVMFLFVFLFSFGVFVNAQTSPCGDKPADSCLEEYKVTHVCELEEECEGDASVLKRFFSTGQNFIKQSPARNGLTSISMNVCTEFSETINMNQNFYIISDSVRSSWLRKRYSVYEFKKGRAETVTFDPGGRKRNVNYAIYDGNCTVNVFSRYSGASTDHKRVQTTIVEVGLVQSTMCKSRNVNPDSFQTNSNLLSTNTCSGGELRDTFINGSVFTGRHKSPATSRSSWQWHTVNVCNFFGENSVTNLRTKDFYVVMEQTSAWWEVKYPVFQFTFGTQKLQVDSKNNFIVNDPYRYRFRTKKENVPVANYDGNCSVSFRLFNRGDDTDAWKTGYDLIEAGFTQNATCKDPAMTASVLRYPNLSYRRERVETEVKQITPLGNYQAIAPFFNSIPDCGGSILCKMNPRWVQVTTDEICPLCDPNTLPEQFCRNNRMHTYVCALDGTWQEKQTEDTCMNISCTPDRNPVVISVGQSDTQPVTFTSTLSSGITNPKYIWTNIQTRGTLATTANYTTGRIQSTGQRTWTIPIQLQVISTQSTATSFCPITIIDENFIPPPPPTNDDDLNLNYTFSFSPSIANQLNNTACTLVADQEVIEECVLKNRINTPHSMSNPNVPIGTWTLYCGESSTPYVTRTCTGPTNFQEF